MQIKEALGTLKGVCCRGGRRKHREGPWSHHTWRQTGACGCAKEEDSGLGGSEEFRALIKEGSDKGQARTSPMLGWGLRVGTADPAVSYVSARRWGAGGIDQEIIFPFPISLLE